MGLSDVDSVLYGPGEWALEGSHEVDQGPSNDDVVVSHDAERGED